MRTPYVIPCSGPEHWWAALDRTAQWALSCKAGHPLLYWRGRAETLLAGTATAEDRADLALRFLVPAAYLCRLAYSLTNFAPAGPAYESEASQALRDPGSFFPFEHVLNIASRIKHAGYEVELVGPLKDRRAPDLIVPAHRVAIEARARGPGSPRSPLRDDFEHAEGKFTDDFARPERAGWTGILAVDFGVCGTKSLPNVARCGPSLSGLTHDLDAELAAARLVAGAAISWVGPVAAPEHVGMIACSGWKMREGTDAPPCIADAFDPWEKQSGETAVRTTPDGRDPRR